MDASYYDAKALEKERLRVFDVCNGCRRCFNLCPSFEVLFNRIDEQDGEIDRLTAKDSETITDLCYYCKLCYNHCPYTPPHHFNIDFPRLMLRGKAVKGRAKRASFRDRFLSDTDRLGRLSSRLASLINWGNRSRAVRLLLQRILGIHKDRLLPPVHGLTFERWRARQAPQNPLRPRAKVALFHTCFVNYNDPGIGRDAIAVLEKNEVEVLSPRQVCCGMPFFDTGDLDAARAKARANISALEPVLARGYDIVALMPTCSLMLKKEYPYLLGAEAQRVSERTFDICEYLMRMQREGNLSQDFRHSVGKIAYQIPCHLRDQNIGYKSRDLMRLIPQSEVQVIERCSAHDGTWGIKREFFDESLRMAQPLVREMEDANADILATDCPLAGIQIEQVTGRHALHPIQILRQAYGI